MTTPSKSHSLRSSCDCPCLIPDPDIAGKGAIAAFTVTSGITLIFAVLALFTNVLGYGEGIDVYSLPEFLQRRWTTNASLKARLWMKDLFFPMMFSLSDTQLITSLAIMVAGGYGFEKGALGLPLHRDRQYGVDGYGGCTFEEDEITGRSTTHNRNHQPDPENEENEVLDFQAEKSSAAASAKSLDSDRPDIQPYLFGPSRLFRAFLMTCQFVMLIVITTIQGHKEWYTIYNCPVSCVLDQWKPGGEPWRWAQSDYAMLVWAYATAIIPMLYYRREEREDIPWTPTSPKLVQIRSRIRRVAKALRRSITAIRRDIQDAPYGIGWTFRLINSMTFDVMFTLAWFGVGLNGLLVARSAARGYFLDLKADPPCTADASAEDQWGFGQLVPLLLLIVPLLATMDAFARRSEKNTT